MQRNAAHVLMIDTIVLEIQVLANRFVSHQMSQCLQGSKLLLQGRVLMLYVGEQLCERAALLRRPFPLSLQYDAQLRDSAGLE